MKSRVFAGIAILALIVAAVILFFVLAGGNATSDREISGTGYPDYVYAGSDDTLYLFTGNNISAVSSDGSVEYRYTAPSGWNIGHRWQYSLSSGQMYISESDYPIVSSEGGTLYVYLVPATYNISISASRGYYNDGRLTAIGPEGSALWDVHMESLMVRLNDERTYSDTYLEARGDRIYVFHGYNETVLSLSGEVLWNIDSVSDPAAVDEAGNLYVMEATSSSDSNTPIIPVYHSNDYVTLADYRTPSVILDAYYPNGTLHWRSYTIVPPERQQLDADTLNQPFSLPLYNKGTIYAVLEDGVRAFDLNGSQKWYKPLDKYDYPFQASDTMTPSFGIPYIQWTPVGGEFEVSRLMPFDSEGNLYLSLPSDPSYGFPITSYIIVIGPDGSDVSSRKIRTTMYYAISNGTAFGTENSLNMSRAWDYYSPVSGDLNELSTETLVACDPKTGARLWNYTLPTDMRTVVAINASNARNLFPPGNAEQIIKYNEIGASSLTAYYMGMSVPVDGRISTFSIRPCTSVIYVHFQTYKHDSPVVFNQSKYVYSGGLYALDYNGTLQWRMSLSPNDQVIAASNSTIIYNTWDGKTYAKALGAIAGGVVLASSAYLAFYFFAGTVTRARSRLDKNGNRTDVFRYVLENPGTTLYEIARGTGINRGTVRYHLFILGTNHRIVAHEAGEKFVRYFTNAGTYSDRERTIISLLRRDVTGKVLRLISKQPGIGSVDLAREMGIHESVAHRSLKELLDMGILTRETAGRSYAYSLKGDDRELVLRSAEKLARYPGKDRLSPGQ